MKRLSLFIPLFVLFACSSTKKSLSLSAPAQLVIDGKLWSSAFQQRAAEYKALCYQAYNIARLRINEALQAPASLPRAIVTDIDETFLDNSPYPVHQGLQGKDYETPSWKEWTGLGIADTLAGSFGFFQYAASKGIEVFYISNRNEDERKGTLSNLQRLGFPNADDDHLILRKDNSSKEARRQGVAASHEIVLLLGDNLADFSAIFDAKQETERTRLVRDISAEFGRRFIVLPNANYGGWEDAIYLNKRGWTATQKDSLVRSGLKSY